MDTEAFVVNSVNRRSSHATTSHPWIRNAIAVAAISSVYGVIVLVLLLSIPISVLVIGVRYRDPRYCAIEPRISRFLIVSGSVSIGWIVSWILSSIILILSIRRYPVITILAGIILTIIAFVITIFLVVWLILGSVWTFSVRNRVEHEYDTINHFYPYTYCHPVLYKFTFVYLIVMYVSIVLHYCYYCYSCTRR